MSDNLSSRAHKVVSSGDSYIKGFATATAIQSVLKSDYKLLSVVKPVSSTNMLSVSMMETVNQLTYNDVLVISSGTNDYEMDNFNSTFRNIKKSF